MNGPSARAGYLDDAARRLNWNIEKSFRMSKSDLRARPIYHRKRDSIEDRTGWSIRKFVRTARRYRNVQIRDGQHIFTAEDPLPPDLREIPSLIK